MSVLAGISEPLGLFVWNYLGEERVHDLGGEFLGVPYEASNPHFDDVDIVVHNSDLFTAWLWFDYREKNKSMLELFAEKHGDTLLPTEQRLLGQMLDTQVMSLFRVGEHHPGSIELEDLRTGVHYRVREYSMEKDIETGQVVVLRLCRQDDHWEIVMPNGSITPIHIRDEAFLEKLASSLPERPTIKDTLGYTYLLREHGIFDGPSDEVSALKQPQLSKQEAAGQLRQAMEETGINRYIAPEKIMKIIDEEFAAKKLQFIPSTGARILTGLTMEPEQRDRLMSAAMDYWNAHVSKRKVAQLRSGKRKVNPLLEPFYPEGWVKYADNVRENLTTEQVSEAQIAAEELFAMMLKQHMTPASLYRLVTNTAIAYLAGGDLIFGTYLIDKALELCPDYDFALSQQQMIEDGAYVDAVLASIGKPEKLKERLEALSERIAPPRKKLRKLNDEQLLKHFVDHGVIINPKTFQRTVAKYTDQSAYANSLITDEDQCDYIYALLDEARSRWAPDVIWPDTLHDYCWNLDEFIYPAVGERANYQAALGEAGAFAAAMKKASAKTIKSWMQAGDYAEEREAIIFFADAALAKKKAALYGVLSGDLCETAFSRTKDPIFHIPKLLGEIVKLGDRASSKKIDALAQVALLDDTVPRLIGDLLVESRPELARYAYELSLAVLDKRRRKGIWRHAAFTHSTLLKDYDTLGEALTPLYKQLDDKIAIEVLQAKLKEVNADKKLIKLKQADKVSSGVDNIMEQDHPESSILDYLRWFDTLDIDLSPGDGQSTILTRPSQKIGRNDPCPCGATKPDGTPLKYKKCHGKAI